MKLFIIALYVATLPWNNLFRQDLSLNDNMVWAALDISWLDVNFKDGNRAGLWGLTPAVARSYGLRVDQLVDERFDVKRSSQAAAYYLKDLITKYNNDSTRALLVFINTPFRQVGDLRWITPGRIPRDVPAQKIYELTEEYNISDHERQCRIAEAESLRKAQRQQAQYIAQAQPQSKTQPQAQQPQPQTQQPQTQPKPQSQTQPQQQTKPQPQQQAKPQQAQQPKSQASPAFHVVKSGETLGHIAMKYHCTVNQLKQWNNLKSDIIQIGQKLKVK